MVVHWLEQSASEVPADDSWLNANEAVRLNAMRIAKRRADWRLGRWTAKQAVAAQLHLSADLCRLAEIEIRPQTSGAPQAFVNNRRAPLDISISHRQAMGLCAISSAEGALGCDLEFVETHSDEFVRDYFTVEEQRLIAGTPEADRIWLVPVLWSAKESALKALGEGLRMDTRSVSVHLGEYRIGDCWHPLQVDRDGGETFHGWWSMAGDLVRTMVSSPAPGLPVRLSNGHFENKAD
ncbi:MAG: 4'-phosphopantetheinyl transferase family protein [Terriglobales bacterium]